MIGRDGGRWGFDDGRTRRSRERERQCADPLLDTCNIVLVLFFTSVESREQSKTVYHSSLSVNPAYFFSFLIALLRAAAARFSSRSCCSTFSNRESI